MSSKITLALVFTIIAFTSSALAAGNGRPDNEYTYKSAQYCIPQYDELPGMTRVYCRA
jgi:hypothetical protein